MTAGVIAAAVCLLAAAATSPGRAADVREVRHSAFATAEEGCDAARTAAKLDFKLKDLRGATVKLADFKGKVILLNFWATWCAPCKAEIPDFVELHARHAEAGLQVLGVSADDTVKQLKPFVDALKMNYPVLQARGNNALLDAYAISTLPVTVIIGRDGTICRRYTAPVAKDILERQIKSLL